MQMLQDSVTIFFYNRLCVPAGLTEDREFTKGGFSKGGLAIYVFPLCNCNTLGFVLNVQFENMPNC